MARMVIDFWMDGYDSEEEMRKAIPDYLYDMVNSSGTQFRFIEFVDEKPKDPTPEGAREVIKE